LTSNANTATNTLQLLHSYIDRGWPVLPLHGIKDGACTCKKRKNCDRSAGKHPIGKLVPNGVLNATLDKAVVSEWYRIAPYANWGIRTGCALPGGGYLIALDTDPRNGGDETLGAIQGIKGKLPETPIQITGSRGTHHLFRSSQPLNGGAPGPGIELKGVNGYIVVHPSKTTGEYHWDVGAHPDDVEVADTPTWIVEGSAGAITRPDRHGEVTARETVLGESFALAGLLGPEVGNGAIAVPCFWADQHSDARGRGKDSSCVILPPAGGSKFGSWKCQHAHCAGRQWIDVINMLPKDAVAQARAKYPMRPVEVVKEALEPASSADPYAEIREKLLFKTMKNGAYKVANDIVNVSAIIKYDPRWKGLLKFDEFTRCLRFTQTPPWHPDDAPAYPSEVWQDEDYYRMRTWCKRYWDVDISDENIKAGVAMVAHNSAVHLVRDYLNSLTWDGVKRVDTWLTDYFGVEDSDYSRLVGKLWLISAVARVMEPGCKVDHMLILEGLQSIGKSKSIMELTGLDWFCDTPFELGSKDGFLAMRGKWIIELQELESMNRADNTKAKAFFTSQADTYRPPYGREIQTVPRQCVFIGTTNQSSYLRDETGNRRYWPVTCTFANWPGLQSDRDQIWAEVCMLYKAGERWYPNGAEEVALCTSAQSIREELDAWAEPVYSWLESDEAKRLYAETGIITTADVLSRALKIEQDRWSRADQARVGTVMVGLGWRRRREAHKRGYVRG